LTPLPLLVSHPLPKKHTSSLALPPLWVSSLATPFSPPSRLPLFCSVQRACLSWPSAYRSVGDLSLNHAPDAQQFFWLNSSLASFGDKFLPLVSLPLAVEFCLYLYYPRFFYEARWTPRIFALFSNPFQHNIPFAPVFFFFFEAVFLSFLRPKPPTAFQLGRAKAGRLIVVGRNSATIRKGRPAAFFVTFLEGQCWPPPPPVEPIFLSSSMTSGSPRTTATHGIGPPPPLLPPSLLVTFGPLSSCAATKSSYAFPEYRKVQAPEEYVAPFLVLHHFCFRFFPLCRKLIIPPK